MCCVHGSGEYIYLVQVNVLSQAVHGKRLLPHHQAPAEYTGELYGVEYLYSQTGVILPGNLRGAEIDKEIDEGFCDVDVMEAQCVTPSQVPSEDYSTFSPPSDSEDEDVCGIATACMFTPNNS